MGRTYIVCLSYKPKDDYASLGYYDLEANLADFGFDLALELDLKDSYFDLMVSSLGLWVALIFDLVIGSLIN